MFSVEHFCGRFCLFTPLYRGLGMCSGRFRLKPLLLYTLLCYPRNSVIWVSLNSLTHATLSSGSAYYSQYHMLYYYAIMPQTQPVSLPCSSLHDYYHWHCCWHCTLRLALNFTLLYSLVLLFIYFICLLLLITLYLVPCVLLAICKLYSVQSHLQTCL